MTSLNKDSTFEREELSEMLSAGRQTQNTQADKKFEEGEQSIGGNSRRGVNAMAQAMNFGGSNVAGLVDPS